MTDIKESLISLKNGIPLSPLPTLASTDSSVPHAPKRPVKLSSDDFKLAVKNALRYFPVEHHAVLALEFANELRTLGHIYMSRFRPVHYEIKAYSYEMYPTKCVQAS